MACGTRVLWAARHGSRLVLFLGIAVATAPLQVSAAAWTLDAGTGQAIVTATASTANAVFDGARGLYPAPRYNKFDFQGLFEYGATDWLTLVLNPGSSVSMSGRRSMRGAPASTTPNLVPA